MQFLRYWDFVECCCGTDTSRLICVFMFSFFVHVSVFADALRDSMLKVVRCLSSCLQ